MSIYSFQFVGRFKPYVRMTQRSKWVNAQAQEYLTSKARLRQRFQEEMLFSAWDMLPKGVHLAAQIVIRAPGGLNNRDLDNEVKAILDAAQGIVFPDDRWFNLLFAFKIPYCKGMDDWYTSVQFWALGDAVAELDLHENGALLCEMIAHGYENYG